MHQKPMGYISAQKNWTAISHTMEQSLNLTKFETKLMTAPQHGKQMSDSFGPKYNLSVFDAFYLHKYSHDFS